MTRNIELKEGAVLTVSVELNVLNEEGDAWEGISSEHKAWYKIDFSFTVGGKTYTRNNGLITDTKYLHNTKKLSEDVKSAIFFSDMKAFLTFRAEITEKIVSAINEMEKELETPEAKKLMEDEKESEKKENNDYYQEIIDTAKKEGVEKLLSEKDITEWRKNYNNLYNEGGEGFVPRRISKEEYENAVKNLK